jgi:hypothetical protein
MFLESTQNATSEEFETLAETLADLLSSNGDETGANEVLSIVSKQANTPLLALRRAEHHLSNRDPASALAALIPIWEAGYEDEEIESLMGIVSLILGLDDVVDNLTTRENASTSLSILRWVLSCCDIEIHHELDLQVPTTQWSLIRMAKIFAEQGREDIVGAITMRLQTLGAVGLLGRMSAIPKRNWILATPAQPPINLRDAITDSVTIPARQAAYNWVWSAARQVFRGESVLIVGVDAQRFAPLFEHADLTTHNIDGVQTTEEELQKYSSASFDHVVMVYGYENGCSARDLTHLLWRSLRHGGQLHLVSGTHHFAHCFESYIHPSRVTSMLEKVGFEMLGHQIRDSDGLPVEDDRGRVLVLRAQKNLV